MAPFLESARIKNFKSLGDINLSFKNLTIIVGANSSGKSCCLESLNLLKSLIRSGKILPSSIRENDIRRGYSTGGITLQVFIKEKRKKIDYSINLTIDNPETNFVVASEHLKIAKVPVIAINKGEGNLQDEIISNSSKQPYHATSKEVALSSVGNIGDKPITKSLANFIKKWEFYDLDPRSIRLNDFLQSRIEPFLESPTILDFAGMKLQSLLQHWASDNIQIFTEVSREVRRYLNIELFTEDCKGKLIVKAKESNGLEIPFGNLSDGSLRIIGYCSLLYSPDIPTLIAIEEPESNLHPGILQDVASILKRLSQKTQVVITTHSSQLLDCFSMEDITSNDVSVILFKKNPDIGTEAIGLETLIDNNAGLQDWMQDFGIGSAIYHSNLIQEVLEN